MTPEALQKTRAKLARQGKAAIGEAVALRGRLAALQAMTADAAYGAIDEGLRLRRGLYQRNQVGSEIPASPGLRVTYSPAKGAQLGKVKEGPALNWRLLFGRGLVT